MSAEIVDVEGLRVLVDRERRRLVIYGPVPMSLLSAARPLSRLWREVCGRDAVSAAGLAICSAGDAEAWLAEFGAEGGAA